MSVSLTTHNKQQLHASPLPVLVFALICAAVLSGCRIGKPEGSSFASVEIAGKAPDEICKTTAAVFQEDGYQVASLTPANMVFQKQGTHGQSLAYGGVVDTYYGGSTAVRVRAQLVDLGAKGYRLQCEAFMVRNANDSFFEDESRVTNVRRMPYQNLLDKVAKRLK